MQRRMRISFKKSWMTLRTSNRNGLKFIDTKGKVTHLGTNRKHSCYNMGKREMQKDLDA